jgi:hypothetical protein
MGFRLLPDDDRHDTLPQAVAVAVPVPVRDTTSS